VKKILGMLAAASLTFAQTASESETVLANARQKVLALAQRLTRYTCVQTIDREYFVLAPAHNRGKLLTGPESGHACSATLDQPANNLILASGRSRTRGAGDSGRRGQGRFPLLIRCDLPKGDSRPPQATFRLTPFCGA
jgi:hypothetical protein